ncbi:membrane hypothetical protein [Candidatus Methylacidithermus pantelleriae]|uniref:Uncharacterized protein n=1 Tax=Candidatus Methylacidithermus pantelleriae TaxID=2744239 RepID=A0A8J2BWG8_9BACT|nr:membrane hypothetical protein [Candidatus Methylacidithermus pantelleriae]
MRTPNQLSDHLAGAAVTIGLLGILTGAALWFVGSQPHVGLYIIGISTLDVVLGYRRLRKSKSRSTRNIDHQAGDGHQGATPAELAAPLLLQAALVWSAVGIGGIVLAVVTLLGFLKSPTFLPVLLILGSLVALSLGALGWFRWIRARQDARRARRTQGPGNSSSHL